MTPSLAMPLQALTTTTRKELIGALLLGWILALALAGVYALGRRRASDPRLLVGGLVFLASIASIALGLGYARGTGSPTLRADRVVHEAAFRVPTPLDAGDVLACRIFEQADSDEDGRLSPEEAARAAARFVRRLDPGGTGTIDLATLGRAVGDHLPPPPHDPPGPPPTFAASAPR